MKRGDGKEWVASFDGFYLSHYNNSSATLHDHSTGKVAWFTHRTKRGPGHTGPVHRLVLSQTCWRRFLARPKMRDLPFRNSYVTRIRLQTPYSVVTSPEGTITYCSNHSAKNLHKNLEKIKRSKCEVRIFTYTVCRIILYLLHN